MHDHATKTADGRERRRLDSAARIDAAILEALAKGDPATLSHDALAAMAGVSRRTVYRCLPDREALMRRAYDLINSAAGPVVRMPQDERELLENLPGIFSGFDHAESVLIATMGTPQGRAVRNAMKPERVASYRAALAGATKDMAEPDRTMAVAVIQLLASAHAWIEMREQWDLKGPAAAKASIWAMRTLIRDLRARAGRPLEDEDC